MNDVNFWAGIMRYYGEKQRIVIKSYSTKTESNKKPSTTRQICFVFWSWQMPSSFHFFVLGCKTLDSFLFAMFNSAEALMGVPNGANSQPPCAFKLCSPLPKYEFREAGAGDFLGWLASRHIHGKEFYVHQVIYWIKWHIKEHHSFPPSCCHIAAFYLQQNWSEIIDTCFN